MEGDTEAGRREGTQPALEGLGAGTTVPLFFIGAGDQGQGRPKAAPTSPGVRPYFSQPRHTHTTELQQPYQAVPIPPNPCRRLVIEDVEGPEVTLNILSDSLLQVTLRSKLYLSFQE